MQTVEQRARTVIDFRARPLTAGGMGLWTHPESRARLRRMVGTEPGDEQTLDQFVAQLDADGVDQVVYPGRAPYRGESISNDHVADCVAAAPDRIIGFAGIDVAMSRQAALAEIDRSVGLGLRGVALDPTFAGLTADHSLLYPVYDRCAERGIPVLVASGAIVGRMDDPLRFDRVAADFPDLRLVIAHGIWPATDMWLALAYRHAHVYLEVSVGWRMPGVAPLLVEAAHNLVGDKLIYASAYPVRPLAEWRALHALGFAASVWQRLSRDNALCALGTPP